MADNKQSKGVQDRIKVDLRDPSEVEYLHQQFPEKSHVEIQKAILAAGPYRDDIEEYLRKNENS